MHGAGGSIASRSRAAGRGRRSAASEHGLVATPYEKRHGELARPLQALLIYLFHPSTDVYTCPLAMTDGAAKTLLVHGNQAAASTRPSRASSSRDPAFAWTSGQWMTERTGGSDVGLSETEARPDGRGALPALRHQVVHQRRHRRRWR